MKSAGELVVHAAASHFFKRVLHHLEQLRIMRGLVAFEDQVDGGGMRKFRTVSKAAVARIVALQDGGDLRVDQRGAPVASRASKNLGLGYGAHERGGGFLDFAAAGAKGVGDAFEDAAKTGAAHRFHRRKISATVKGPAVGKQKTGKRPAALAGNGVDRGLVARVHVGAFVAIHFHGNKQAIDQRGERGIVVAFAVNDVAPVAPYRADIEQNGFVVRARAGKSLFSPFMPIDGLVRRRAQVGTRGLRQPIGLGIGNVTGLRNFAALGNFGSLRHVSILSRRACGVGSVHCTGLFGLVSPGSISFRAVNPSSWRCQ